MSFTTQSPDFIAELQYLTTQEGGRKTPVVSGYRPQIKFSFSKYSTSGQQKFIDQEIVKPGDTVQAEITILSPRLFKNKLEIGMKFEVGEGSKVVAIGRLVKIINVTLQSE